MIEICVYYNVRDKCDQEGLSKFGQDFAMMLQKAEGMIEFHSFKNVAGSKTRWKDVTTWKTLAAWATVTEDRKFQHLIKKLYEFCEDVKYEIWMEGSVFIG